MTEKSILVVEDEGILAIGLKKRLENLGFYVPGIASSGPEAVDMATKFKPDLILMDIVLKGDMDGIEAADMIHSALKIPVIFLTAYSDNETLSRAKITEPSGYILKPFNERELQVAIEVALYKNTMEKLRESKHWLETALKSIGEAIIATDLGGAITFMNPASESLLSWSFPEALGRSHDEVIKIEEESKGVPVESPVMESLKDNRVVRSSGDNVINTKDSRKVPVSYSSAPIIDNDGRVMGVITILKDLTEVRKQEMESKMRETIMDLSINALCVTDVEGKILYANSIFGSLWGYKEEEALGEPISEVCRIEDADKGVGGALIKKGNCAEDVRAYRKDGSSFHVQISVCNIKDRTGSPVYVVYSFIDITEIKLAREELKSYLTKLHQTEDQTDEAIEQLSLNLSKASSAIHEMETVLSGEPAGAIDNIRRALDALSRTRSIVDELADSSFPMPLYISLIELYQRKIDEFDRSSSKKNHELKCK